METWASRAAVVSRPGFPSGSDSEDWEHRVAAGTCRPVREPELLTSRGGVNHSRGKRGRKRQETGAENWKTVGAVVRSHVESQMLGGHAVSMVAPELRDSNHIPHERVRERHGLYSDGSGGADLLAFGCRASRADEPRQSRLFESWRLDYPLTQAARQPAWRTSTGNRITVRPRLKKFKGFNCPLRSLTSISPHVRMKVLKG